MNNKESVIEEITTVLSGENCRKERVSNKVTEIIKEEAIM